MPPPDPGLSDDAKSIRDSTETELTSTTMSQGHKVAPQAAEPSVPGRQQQQHPASSGHVPVDGIQNEQSGGASSQKSPVDVLDDGEEEGGGELVIDEGETMETAHRLSGSSAIQTDDTSGTSIIIPEYRIRKSAGMGNNEHAELAESETRPVDTVGEQVQTDSNSGSGLQSNHGNNNPESSRAESQLSIELPKTGQHSGVSLVTDRASASAETSLNISTEEQSLVGKPSSGSASSIPDTTGSTVSTATAKMYSADASGVQGLPPDGSVMSTSPQGAECKMRLRPWLENMINTGAVQGLEWLDSECTHFKIPWKHRSKKDWNVEHIKIFLVRIVNWYMYWTVNIYMI